MARLIGLVEDETAIRENYAAVLRRQGYEVHGYASRGDALAAFRTRLPDLAVVDVGLGDEVEGGFDLCRELRSMAPRLPIIFLTARDTDLDVISGLRLGADDYLSKQTSLPHLLARIAALLRRVEALRAPADANTTMQRGDLVLDADRLSATWRGQPLDLTVTEFWILHSLARFPGHVKSRDQLMDAAYGEHVYVDDRTIDSHIKRLRKKFKAIDGAFSQIETLYGIGYRYEEQ